MRFTKKTLDQTSASGQAPNNHQPQGGNDMVKAAEKDLSTIIKHVEGKGAASFFYINEANKGKLEGRINAKELGQIRNAVEKIKEKGLKLSTDFLMNPFCPWSEKNFLHNDIEEAGLNDVEAYEFMANFNTGAKGPAKKTDAEKLASILVSLAPVLSPKELGNRLEKMIEENMTEAIKLVEKMEKENKRDSNYWIYTTTEEQRKKLADAKTKKKDKIPF